MKDRASKLDPFAEKLDVWFRPVEAGGEGLTLVQACERMKKLGCDVSPSRLSDWAAERRARAMQSRLLGQIASGARQAQEVEKELQQAGGGPELETLIKLHRVLILKLSTEGQADTELLELVNRMMKPVVQFARLQQLREQLNLDRDRFQFDAAKACLAALPELKAISVDKGLSEPEKVQQIRLKLFGVVPETESLKTKS